MHDKQKGIITSLRSLNEVSDYFLTVRYVFHAYLALIREFKALAASSLVCTRTFFISRLYLTRCLLARPILHLSFHLPPSKESHDCRRMVSFQSRN